MVLLAKFSIFPVAHDGSYAAMYFEVNESKNRMEGISVGRMALLHIYFLYQRTSSVCIYANADVCY